MSEEAAWLKTVYEEAAPAQKRVKYSNVKERLEGQFPEKSFNSQIVTGYIKEAFPSAFTKRLGESRQTMVVGIKPVDRIPASSDRTCNECVELKKHLDVVNTRLSEAMTDNARLKQLVSEQQKFCPGALSDQLGHLVSPGNAVYHGPDTLKHFSDFTIDTLISECKEHAPDVLQLMMNLGHCLTCDTSNASAQEIKALMSLFTLVKCRSAKVLGMQLLIILMLLARSASRQTITTLNHAGVCCSYNTAWKYLKQLTGESKYEDVILNDHWMWVYDNLNIHQRVRHERQDHHSKMLNLTSRLAIKVVNLPQWEVDWSDCSPQRSLTLTDFMPTEDDAGELKKRAINYVMKLLVDEFPSLADLKPYATSDNIPTEVAKCEVVPMVVLFKDEKYIADTF